MKKKAERISTIETGEKLPLIALRGMVAFPGMLLNFDVDRDISVAALDAANRSTRRVLLVTQREFSTAEPTPGDLYEIGTICNIKQLLKTNNGGCKVLVEGASRAFLDGILEFNGYFIAMCTELPEPKLRDAVKGEALMRNLRDLFGEYVQISANVEQQVMFPLFGIEEPGKAADYITQNLFIRHAPKQQILETLPIIKRLNAVLDLLSHEVAVIQLEREVSANLQGRFANQQRENILRERMNAMRQELGEAGDSEEDEFDEYKARIEALEAPQEVRDKLLKELNRLTKQGPHSADTSVIRTYLDHVLDLPWNKVSREKRDITAARAILDSEHFGLDKVKDRIIEFLAVRALKPDAKGTILCLLGPPGVGKTSIAMSVAHATGRKIARLSLGGVHDEAEIRGHRKTYVGAMPGRIMEAIVRAGTKNPILVLDEIDKLGSDYRGDPSAALLEALDPEQNYSFRDHYLEVPFDLSDVIFITTANSSQTIPRPLLDRVEVIEIGSYTDIEKTEIAKRHLLPKQKKKHGIKAAQLKISDTAIMEIVDGYTRESGVRQLERELASVCRRAATGIAKGEKKSFSVTPRDLEKYLGPRKYTPEPPVTGDEVGLVRGLAWTEVGGTTLDVEVNVLPGMGQLKLTGNLGAVMKESAEAAVSYIRSRADKLGIPSDFYRKVDLHIHFPEGAVQKDGPSAGITMAIAVISALTGAPVRPYLAMTGEISLRGRILRIGGLREKTMAALRAGAKTVIIPADNEADLEEIDQTVRRSLEFVTARHIDNILNTALDFDRRTPLEILTRPLPAGPGENGGNDNMAVLPMIEFPPGGQPSIPARI